MTKLYYLTVVTTAFLLLSVSCDNNKERKEIERIVATWSGKTLMLPKELKPTSFYSDSIADPAKSGKPFKILNFTDATGCTSCKLKLLIWNAYMQEVDTTMADKVDFLFYFHPQNERELELMLRADRFKHPVYLDRGNRLDALNKLPTNQAFQCFLLDSNNKILLIGNPTHNPQLWNLYKEIISGRKSEKAPVTYINIDHRAVDVGSMQLGRMTPVSFTIENTGKTPLLITHIDASCGCTKPVWDRSPIKPGTKTEIRVEITPDEKGYFDKTLQVFCNTAEGRIALKITGEVE